MNDFRFPLAPGAFKSLGGAAFALLLTAPTLAQAPGWSWSPLPGEGDRATLGCALGSNTERFACLAVRCEDDYSVGIHIHTSRPQGDAGPWRITIDKEDRGFTATPSGAPYGARIEGDTAWLLDGIRQGATAYLHPSDGAGLSVNSISLAGSLYAVNHALAYCAPRVPEGEPIGADGR